MKIDWQSKKTTLVLLVVMVPFLVAASILFGRLSSPAALRVVDTTPKEQALYSPYLPVTITFNRAPKAKEVSFTIVPTTSVSYSSLTEKTITITPRDIFQPKTGYQIQINTTPPYALSFTTEQSEETAPGYSQAYRQALQLYQGEHATQDAALANMRLASPITESGFSVTYSYADNTYTVTLSTPYDQNRTVFLAWIKQLGITDLSTVRIKYINQ